MKPFENQSGGQIILGKRNKTHYNNEIKKLLNKKIMPVRCNRNVI